MKKKVPIEPMNLSLFCWVFAKGNNLWWGPLKLFPNFHMKALFSSHNANDDVEIMVDSSLVALNSYTSLHSSHATLGMLKSLIKLSPNSMKQVSIWVNIHQKKAQENYDATKKWQDTWIAQVAWAKVDIIDGVMIFMKYTVCEVVTSWPK